MRQTPRPLPDRRPTPGTASTGRRTVVADAQGHVTPAGHSPARRSVHSALQGAGGGVSRVQQAQGRRDRLRFAAIACRQRLAADRRAQRLRQLHPRFALPARAGGSPPARR